LKNFKGLRDYTLTPGGEDLEVYGQNASGKTTLFDSFCWLLFGKQVVVGELAEVLAAYMSREKVVF